MTDPDGPVYALNLFDLADNQDYRAYARRSVAEVTAHGGKVVSLGRFRRSETGDVEPRQVMVLVEWESIEAFESYRDDPALADLHPLRENGTTGYIWHLFDKLSDLRPVLNVPAVDDRT
ncbi:DUF1330 domain-containing protein [Gordonia soli]|uniref:DUF1330 domain-containing protein n=1 Tax=Gordonia soli NBRC 108243 TaxID=1223545 RepID=M0QMI7_9ACTN|nr:DUF1330 domain-containing protein [Gordonia soli]GAC69639.1 hypothetical protein GS4_26_00870 [Gordonia soli NBRC 108243]